MKKVLATVLTMMVSHAAFAGDIYCGSNIETVPGSGVYNKSLFWEKADTTKYTSRFLLADGTLIRSENLTPDLLAKIIDGTLVVGYSFTQEKAQLFIATVKHDEQNQIKYINLAMGASTFKSGTFLMANSASLFCQEQN